MAFQNPLRRRFAAAAKSAGYTPRTRPGRAGRPVGTARPGRGGIPKPKPLATRPKPGLGGTAAAPPKPSIQPAAAPQGQKPEFDKPYYDAVDLAERRETQSLSQLEGQEQGVKHEFGLEDPTNPFSRANAMKRAFLSRMKGRSASLASRGQLYSGAHERAVSRTRREEEQARAELRSSYEAAIGQIGAAKAGVKFATEEERNQAFEDWLARAPEADVELTPEQEAAIDAEPEAEGTPSVAPPVAVGGAPQPTSEPRPQTLAVGVPQPTGPAPRRPPRSLPGGRALVSREKQIAKERAERRAAKLRQKTAERRAKVQTRKREARRAREAAPQAAARAAEGFSRGGGAGMAARPKVKPKPRPKARRGRRRR